MRQAILSPKNFILFRTQDFYNTGMNKVFHCPRSNTEQGRLIDVLTVNIYLGNLAGKLLKSKENWLAATSTIIKIQDELAKTDPS